MLDTIYKVVADKILSQWCKIVKVWDNWSIFYNTIARIEKNYKSDIDTYYSTHWNIIYMPDYEIIGHPVMIGDVLDWINNKTHTDIPYWLDEEETEVVIKWLDKRKPIEDQSEECITYIYSLLPTNTDANKEKK